MRRNIHELHELYERDTKEHQLGRIMKPFSSEPAQLVRQGRSEQRSELNARAMHVCIPHLNLFRGRERKISIYIYI